MGDYLDGQPYTRDERGVRVTGEGNEMTEAETDVMCFEDGGTLSQRMQINIRV
jgi:hypothetical protein